MLNATTNTSMDTTSDMTTGNRNEWASFLLLAIVILPAMLVGAIAAYGFVVWGLQVLVFGPPS